MDCLSRLINREATRLALGQVGLMERVVPVPVCFRGVVAGIFKADWVINDAVLMELKSWERLIRQHESQVIDSLRVTAPADGLRMNFGRCLDADDLSWLTGIKKEYPKWQNR
jgi:GxxExxY protein